MKQKSKPLVFKFQAPVLTTCYYALHIYYGRLSPLAMAAMYFVSLISFLFSFLCQE